ncbi:MAG: ATP-binding cassette domain-containing protein, partial [Eubacteriales bacterium]
MEILRTENLSHIYSPKSPFEHRALDDVSLSIETGTLTGIIGRTGSGKSTLISHFNGLLRPTSGKVFVDGEDIWNEPKKIRRIRFKVGLVFQYPEYQLFEDTVEKDIAFGPK